MKKELRKVITIACFLVAFMAKLIINVSSGVSTVIAQASTGTGTGTLLGRGGINL